MGLVNAVRTGKPVVVDRVRQRLIGLRKHPTLSVRPEVVIDPMSDGSIRRYDFPVSTEVFLGRRLRGAGRAPQIEPSVFPELLSVPLLNEVYLWAHPSHTFVSHPRYP